MTQTDEYYFVRGRKKPTGKNKNKKPKLTAAEEEKARVEGAERWKAAWQLYSNISEWEDHGRTNVN